LLKTNPSVVLELLHAAANKGEIELFSLKAEPTDLLSPQWRELVSEVGGFNLPPIGVGSARSTMANRGQSGGCATVFVTSVFQVFSFGLKRFCRITELG